MKIIKGFENEDIVVSDFGEWVGKDYIDYKFEYKNNQKIIKDLLNENKQLKDRDLIIAAELTKLQDENKQQKYNWNKLKSWADYMRVNTLQQNNYGRILDKMQELEQVEELGWNE